MSNLPFSVDVLLGRHNGYGRGSSHSYSSHNSSVSSSHTLMDGDAGLSGGKSQKRRLDSLALELAERAAKATIPPVTAPASKFSPQLSSSKLVDINKARDAVGPKFHCQVCGKLFGAHYNLTRHMPVHTGARPFVCKVCGKAFRQASTLCRHKIIHTAEKPHKCKVGLRWFILCLGRVLHG
jgi:uncharacterized Zn-finger protein